MEKTMRQETLRTGEVAAQAGVNVATLRYYVDPDEDLHPAGPLR